MPSLFPTSVIEVADEHDTGGDETAYNKVMHFGTGSDR